ncbi:3-deoxy-manno-octulosonate cytidylyltransferase [Desulfonatronum lacustre]|uniref:3-deoxy-manno-octulosonate cytidylyltransferase n=1 Tax=Desulfonatronum lacustre TaxID=66849 RepID=UPI00048FADBA|nr:3-deoxy-manno-octulosonate cytidylyltransferase [Desulfonatronum lacustre]
MNAVCRDRPRCHGIIPARFASTRFPGKPLTDILGKPMIWHVYQRARACPELCGVTLATDDQRILDVAGELDIPATMTRDDHPSGTDRTLEAAERLGVDTDDVVVNIQGDEPALCPELLTLLLSPFDDPAVQVSTLARPLSPEEARSPDVVKVVTDAQGQALYFSRALIPYPREGTGEFLGHIGLYAFRMRTLRAFVDLGPGKLEQIEKLEQLRLLEAGIPIRVLRTEHRTHGVDRPEDVPSVCTLLREQGLA